MRYWIIIIVFLISDLGWTQEVYISPYSLHVPTGIVEHIPRVINLSEKLIQIESEAGNDLIDVQTMVILSKKVNYDDFTSYRIYECSSEDGLYPSLVIIEENPAYIRVIQPSRFTGEEEEYRLFLEVNN